MLRASPRALPFVVAIAAIGIALMPGHAVAAGFSVLHAFGGPGDGATPKAGLVSDKSGNLYGTTRLGGSQNEGTIFQIAPDGTETVLVEFTGQSDGAFPVARLAIDTKGNLYGTTKFGGDLNCGKGKGCGVVFKLTPDNTLVGLHLFSGGSDGAFPVAEVALDKKGNLLGTTMEGGGAGCGTAGCGIVFRLLQNGTYKILHAFAGGTDGANPTSGIAVGGYGYFYGTASLGGSTGCGGNGCGTIFLVQNNGDEGALHVFKGGDDGAFPNGILLSGKLDKLVGTTSAGGGTGCGGQGCGTVFTQQIPVGNESILYAFAGGADGSDPEGGIVVDGSGNLDGTTASGGGAGCGGAGCGTLFKLTKQGAETVLYAFPGGSDGNTPLGPPAIVKKVLYGTASGGGDLGGGTVFQLK